MDEQYDPAVTLKVIGRQWYWSYEYSNADIFGSLELHEDCEFDPEFVYTYEIVFDSYLDQDFEETSAFRLLKVDNEVFLPNET